MLHTGIVRPQKNIRRYYQQPPQALTSTQRRNMRRRQEHQTRAAVERGHHYYGVQKSQRGAHVRVGHAPHAREGRRGGPHGQTTTRHDVDQVDVPLAARRRCASRSHAHVDAGSSARSHAVDASSNGVGVTQLTQVVMVSESRT